MHNTKSFSGLSIRPTNMEVARLIATVVCLSLVMFHLTGCGSGSSGESAEKPIPAFPGAEGFGQFAKGGRGGRVIEVTNLTDSGPGSFRQCAEVESGPRTCVFRVGGLIQVTTPVASPYVEVKHPHLTIAGQTAPGDGVTLQGLLWIRTSQVIVRHFRSRPGWQIPNNWNFGIEGDDIILDHCSGSWSTDEGIIVLSGRRITIQWCIVAEGIQDESLPNVRRQAKGINLGGPIQEVTLHHNYLALNVVRNPTIGVSPTGSPFQIVEVVNNLVYYWNNGGSGEVFAGNGPSHSNWVGNAYIQHQDAVFTGLGSLRTLGDGAYASRSGVYVKGNIDSLRQSETNAEELFVWQDNGPFPLVPTRYPAPPLVSETDAFQAYADVLARAGARLPVLDSIDERLLSYARSTTFAPGQVAKGRGGAIIRHEDQVGGFPVYQSGSPPAERDHDGMPDAWELLHGLDPLNPNDGSQDTDGDGYTNLEEFLNNTDPRSAQTT